MILEAMRAMFDAGLNDGTSGNASMRQANGFFISKTGALEDGPGIFVSFAAIMEGNLPDDISTEWRMHEAIYRRRKDINAVIHFHGRFMPGACRLFGAAGEGTQALADQVAAGMATHNHVFIVGHGNVAAGKSMKELLDKVESGKFN